MGDYGMFRVAAATPRVWLADVKSNIKEAESLIRKAEAEGVSLITFPELSVTGYTCADLFGQERLLSAAEEGVACLRSLTRGMRLTVVVGAPVRCRSRLYNCAVVIRNGSIKGIVPKIYLPTYGEFYESRWFASGADFLDSSVSSSPVHDDAKSCYREGFAETVSFAGQKTNISPNMLFSIGDTTFAVEICEDLWTPVPPSSWHSVEGAEIILNLSASNEVIMKHMYRHSLVGNQSARTICGYVYCSCGFGESTQDTVFAGSSMIYENGGKMAENERFTLESSLMISDIDVQKLRILRQKSNTFGCMSPDGTRSSSYSRMYSRVDLGIAVDTDFDKKLYRYVEPHPFVPGGSSEEIDRRCREITSMQVLGLASRLNHIKCRTAVIGISGGLDSTLALLVTVLAFDKLGLDRKGIVGVTMPGFGTTDRTHDNAVDLMRNLGVTLKEISIVPSVNQHFADIEQDPSNHDVTYENGQARERTQILMDIANKMNGIVVGTGDLSELALGWCTYNGDHMSMYGVNASIPKTLVKYLVTWAAVNLFDTEVEKGRGTKDILMNIVDTPISPELKPADENGEISQKTEDIVGPYELHDFFLYNFFRFGFSSEKLLFLAKKAFLGHKSESSVFVGPEGKAVEYTEEIIEKWLKKFFWRFFSQQFKRSCMPDGPKVGSVTLSPRGDWRMPSDAKADMFADL